MELIHVSDLGSLRDFVVKDTNFSRQKLWSELQRRRLLSAWFAFGMSQGNLLPVEPLFLLSQPVLWKSLRVPVFVNVWGVSPIFDMLLTLFASVSLPSRTVIRLSYLKVVFFWRFYLDIICVKIWCNACAKEASDNCQLLILLILSSPFYR